MDKSIFRRFSVLALAALLLLAFAAPAAAWEETGDTPGASPRPTGRVKISVIARQ